MFVIYRFTGIVPDWPMFEIIITAQKSRSTDAVAAPRYGKF